MLEHSQHEFYFLDDTNMLIELVPLLLPELVRCLFDGDAFFGVCDRRLRSFMYSVSKEKENNNQFIVVICNEK